MTTESKKYITIYEAFALNDIEYIEKVNTLFYGIARKLNFFPGYWHMGCWYYHKQAFAEFVQFCKMQVILHDTTDEHILLGELREYYDEDSPFTAKELGCLFRINAVTGKIIKLGGDKKRTKISKISYLRLKEFQLESLQKYIEQFKLIPNVKPDYHYKQKLNNK